MTADDKKDAGPKKKAEKGGGQQAKPSREAKPPKGGKGQKGEAGGKPAKSKQPALPRETPFPPRLREKYRGEVVPQFMRERGCANSLAVPRVAKICLNMGVGKARDDAKAMEQAIEDLTLIAGQRGVATAARKSISNFRVRRGYNVGCKVTLRGARMYEFLDRLVSVAMPRIRDFRGLSLKGFDGRGNYSLGLAEQTVFPEVDPDKVQFTQGMDITIVTTARSDEDALALLKALGMPFRAPQGAAKAVAARAEGS